MSAPRWGAAQRFGRKVKFRLLWVFVAFGIGAGSTWYFREAVFALLFAPAGGNLSPHGGLPIFTSPTEILSANLRLSIMGGAAAALPVLTFSVFQLLSPLLNRQQRRFVILFVPALFVCFLGGAAFAYFVMLPTGLRFLLQFGEGVAVPVIKITEYMALVTALIFWLGIIFELPLAMFLLAKLRAVSHRRFRQFRKYVPVAALILGAIVTPTFDMVNQLMVAVPIWVLYEVGLVGAWLARPREAGHRSCAQKAKAVAAGVWRRRWLVLAALLALALGGLAYVAVFVWDGRLPVEVQAWLDRALEVAGAAWGRLTD